MKRRALMLPAAPQPVRRPAPPETAEKQQEWALPGETPRVLVQPVPLTKEQQWTAMPRWRALLEQKTQLEGWLKSQPED